MRVVEVLWIVLTVALFTASMVTGSLFIGWFFTATVLIGLIYCFVAGRLKLGKGS